MIIRSFKKVGISLPIDGSQDKDEINIEGLKDYTIEEGSEDDEATDDEEISGGEESLNEDKDPFLSCSDSDCSFI